MFREEFKRSAIPVEERGDVVCLGKRGIFPYIYITEKLSTGRRLEGSPFKGMTVARHMC